MGGAIIRLAVAGGVIVLYRWALKLSTPRTDWWYVVEYGQQAQQRIRQAVNSMRVWFLALWRYVPTDAVTLSWRTLRERYTNGAYGEAGT